MGRAPLESGETGHVPKGLGEAEPVPLGSSVIEPVPLGSDEMELVPSGIGESKPSSEGLDGVVVIPFDHLGASVLMTISSPSSGTLLSIPNSSP
jgi:hypothetical protein